MRPWCVGWRWENRAQGKSLVTLWDGEELEELWWGLGRKRWCGSVEIVLIGSLENPIPTFTDPVRGRGESRLFCIMSFYILHRPHPTHTHTPPLFLLKSLSLALSLVMLIAPKVRAPAALPWTPLPPHTYIPIPSPSSPGFEWHVLIRPNLIGRRCLGWIGTTLYSPLLLMCACVCVCVHVRVMHVRLWSVCGWVHESVTRQQGSVFWGVSECVKGCVCKRWFMPWAGVILCTWVSRRVWWVLILQHMASILEK